MARRVEITARFEAKCFVCFALIEVGELVHYLPNRDRGKVRHVTCGVPPKSTRNGWKRNREWMTDEEWRITCEAMSRQAPKNRHAGREHYREAVMQVACPLCRAPKGQRCVGPKGNRRAVHRSRIDQAELLDEISTVRR